MAVVGVGNIPPNESGDIKSARRDVVGKEDDYYSFRAGEGAVRAAVAGVGSSIPILYLNYLTSISNLKTLNQ